VAKDILTPLAFPDTSARDKTRENLGVPRFLTSATDFYVNAATGSDTTGDGTIGNPWQTAQFANDWIVTNCVRLTNVSVTLNLASGNYGDLSITRTVITAVKGNGPANTTIEVLQGYYLCDFTISDVTLGNGSSWACIYLWKGSISVGANVVFGATSWVHAQVEMGRILINAPYTITGNAPTGHFWAARDSIIVNGGQAVTLVGTPTIGYFYTATENSLIWTRNVTFTGTFTGIGYRFADNSYIRVNSAALPASGAQFTVGNFGQWDDTKNYQRENILGTVSQSGGVPTGAIIEEGNNANGRYIKFADGTMICYKRVSFVYVTNTTLWATPTMAAAFVGEPSYSISTSQSGSHRTNVPRGSISLAEADSSQLWFRSINGTTPFVATSEIQYCGVTAIGRWY
jgi:hypothetical protein